MSIKKRKKTLEKYSDWFSISRKVRFIILYFYVLSYIAKEILLYIVRDISLKNNINLVSILKNSKLIYI